MAQSTAEQSRLDAALSVVERVGNRIPQHFVLFAYLLGIVAVVSTLLDLAGVTVSVPGEGQPTEVNGLLTGEGITWFLTSFVENFMLFPPLGNVVVMLLAIGVAERTGLLKTAVTAAFSRAPRSLLPYVVAFVAAQGHVMSDPSMIVIPPLAALVFLEAGRQPLAGMLGAFACTTAGYASWIIIGFRPGPGRPAHPPAPRPGTRPGSSSDPWTRCCPASPPRRSASSTRSRPRR